MFKRDLYKRIVIGVDPALTCHRNSNETGIVVAGFGKDNCGYVLDDLSGKYYPHQWAQVVVEAYEKYQSDRVIVERNAGGDMIEHILRAFNPLLRIKNVYATQSKNLRALPIACLYRQKQIYHVRPFEKLENQLLEYAPSAKTKSPDRIDALVWALSDFMLGPSINRPKIWHV